MLDVPCIAGHRRTPSGPARVDGGGLGHPVRPRERQVGRKARGEQFSVQPEDVRGKVARIKSDGPTKEILNERARELGIRGRSSKSKDQLLRAIERATDGDGRGERRRRNDGANGGRPDLEAMTKGELYARAQARA